MTQQERVYNEIISKVACDIGLPESVVDKSYKAFWLFIRTSLSELPLKDNLTEEEFKQLRTSVNVPSLGKFGCSYERYVNIKKRFEYIKKLQDNVKHKED